MERRDGRMRLYCKCGQCLTKNVQKTSYKNAYDVHETVEEVYGWDDELNQCVEEEFVNKEYIIREGTYYKWKNPSRKGAPWLGAKNVYVVAIPDVLADTVNECQGCCQRHYFDIQCPSCREIVGNGCDDCWQTARAMFYCTKVKVKKPLQQAC